MDYKKMKYFNKWLDKCETKAIFAAFKNMKKRNISINFKDQIDLDKFLEKVNGLLNIKNVKNNLDKWKEIADKRNILEKLNLIKKKR